MTSTPKTVEEQFAEMDKDQDGFITTTELKASLETNPKVSDEDVKQVMKIFDDSNDSKITLDEYRKFAKQVQA